MPFRRLMIFTEAGICLAAWLRSEMKLRRYPRRAIHPKSFAFWKPKRMIFSG
jgi:hypothetical protein